MASKALKEKLEEKLKDNYLLEESPNPNTNIIPFSKEAEINGISIAPDFVITLSEAKQRIALLQQFVKEMMIEGQDYGIIPNCNKPSLFKAGAEKLTDIFGFSKHIEVSNRIEDWDKGLFHYEVKATLISKRSGQIEAEGIGCCNNKEKKYINSPAFNVINTILKMAKKRAFIDAVLSATRTSGLFTQDLEDSGDYEQNINSTHSNPSQNKPTGKKGSTNVSYSNTSTEVTKINSQTKPIEKLTTKSQLNKIQSLVNEKCISVNKAKFLISERYNVAESRNLTLKQADDFIKYLTKYQAR